MHLNIVRINIGCGGIVVVFNIGCFQVEFYNNFRKIVLPALALVAALMVWLAGSTAQAQTGDGVLGWNFNGAHYPSADAACAAQWN